jgi:hypothetical protein
VVNKACIDADNTVKGTVTVAPALSLTKILALPIETPMTARLLSAIFAVATLVLLLVAVYGPVPPPTLYD